MALLFADGLDWVNATLADVQVRYPEYGAINANSTFQTNTGRFGGGAYASRAGSSLPIPIASASEGTSSNTLFVGFSFFIPAAGTLDTVQNLITFYSGYAQATTNDELQLVIVTPAAPVLQFRRPSGTILATGTTVLTRGAWNWITVGVRLSDSAGVARVDLNGTTYLNLSAVDTIDNVGATSVRSISVFGPAASSMVLAQIDDIMIWNDTGDAPTTFLAPQRIQTSTPTADGAFSGWVPACSSSQAEPLGEARLRLPASAHLAIGTNTNSVFEMSNLSGTPASITAVQMSAVTRNRGAFGKRLRTKVRNAAGSLMANGTFREVPNNWAFLSTALAVDPNTGVAWTQAGIDGGQFGFEAETNTAIPGLYVFRGSDQTLTATSTGTLRARLWGGGGASGFFTDTDDASGGAGGYTDASFPVTSGDTILLRVGGGGRASTTLGTGGAGGWPDGGAGQSGGDKATGGGGGSTRIFKNGVLMAVAGGGGGAAGTGARRGGAGGGATGGAATANGGTGGSQIAGGVDSSDTGNVIKTGTQTGGGAGGNGTATDDGGGGGGGFWGGGGGGGDAQAGGGGSGHVNTVAGASGNTFAGNGVTPPVEGDTAGFLSPSFVTGGDSLSRRFNGGNGLAYLTGVTLT